MTTPLASYRVDPLSPAVIGAALDCLAFLPEADPLDAAILAEIARAIGCQETEASALVARIRAAAIIMNDPRWRPWSRLNKTLPRSERMALDRAFLRIVAELPLNSNMRFSADLFFRALLHFGPSMGHG